LVQKVGEKGAAMMMLNNLHKLFAI